MSDGRRRQQRQNQSHSGDWITDENGSQWYVCSTQKQETHRNKKKGLGGTNHSVAPPNSPADTYDPNQKKLTILIPEDGCGGDDPQEGYLMKGLGTPEAPRPSQLNRENKKR